MRGNGNPDGFAARALTPALSQPPARRPGEGALAGICRGVRLRRGRVVGATRARSAPYREREPLRSLFRGHGFRPCGIPLAKSSVFQ